MAPAPLLPHGCGCAAQKPDPAIGGRHGLSAALQMMEVAPGRKGVPNLASGQPGLQSHPGGAAGAVLMGVGCSQPDCTHTSGSGAACRWAAGTGTGSGTAVRSPMGTQQGCPQLHSLHGAGQGRLCPQLCPLAGAQCFVPTSGSLLPSGPGHRQAAVTDRNRNLLQLHFIVFLINFLSHGGI